MRSNQTDGKMLRRAVVNLVNNAIRLSKKDSIVWVSVAVEPASQPDESASLVISFSDDDATGRDRQCPSSSSPRGICVVSDLCHTTRSRVTFQSVQREGGNLQVDASANSRNARRPFFAMASTVTGFSFGVSS